MSRYKRVYNHDSDTSGSYQKDLNTYYEDSISDDDYNYRVSTSVPPAIMKQIIPLLERGISGDRLAIMISTDGKNAYIGSTSLWRASTDTDYED